MSVKKTSPNIITNGLIWCVDGLNPKSYSGSGTLLTDLSSVGNHGTLIGGITRDSGGNWELDGATKYIQSNTSTGDPNASYTLSCWANITTTSPGHPVVRGADGFGNGWSLYATFSAGGAVRAAVVTTSAGAQAFVADGTTPTIANTWYYVTAVWEAGVSIRAYLNGILEATTPTSTTVLRASTTNFNIGLIIAGSIFNGKVGLCTAYDRVLSQPEILQNFNATRGRYGI